MKEFKWHKWPEEKPVENKACIVAIGEKTPKQFHYAGAKFINGEWICWLSPLGITHWAEIPPVEEN